LQRNHVGYRDTRGADFPEVLKIAAALAGVELEEATETEREEAKEKGFRCKNNISAF
jgi:hypothetical protein